MSHRKFEAPRHGSLGFLPRKRARTHRGRIRSFPKDDAKKAPHLTAFPGWKAGMTHITRLLERPKSRLNKCEIVEAVTIIETPPIKAVGIVGYIDTPKGLRALTTVWSTKLSEGFKRRFYKNWYSSKKKAFSKYVEKFDDKDFKAKINRLVKYCTVVRLIVHTQPNLVKALHTKKSSVIEIQVNGGSVANKVAFAQQWLEKDIKVNDVLSGEQIVDVIGVTKGHGFNGVTKRWGTQLLQKKTHRGIRKVGCIGAWHPSRVRWTAARAGQMGYHHRTEPGKKIYRIGKAASEGVHNNASTETDLTEKNITPMGGFPHYGVVNHDYVMIKGCCVGYKSRPLILRHQIHNRTTRSATEKINLRFIDTSSKLGHGKFQTTSEKNKFYGREDK